MLSKLKSLLPEIKEKAYVLSFEQGYNQALEEIEALLPDMLALIREEYEQRILEIEKIHQEEIKKLLDKMGSVKDEIREEIEKEKECTCCVEYDEDHQRIYVVCEKHKEEENERLKKEYEQTN